jgi:hypothetical protein
VQRWANISLHELRSCVCGHLLPGGMMAFAEILRAHDHRGRSLFDEDELAVFDLEVFVVIGQLELIPI